MLFIKRNHQNLTSTKKEIPITLQYLGKTSLQVKKKTVKGHFSILSKKKKEVKRNIVFKSSKRIKNAFPFKHILPKNINSKVLYKFRCNTCNSVFIAKTKQHLLVCQYKHFLWRSLYGKGIKVYRKRCNNNQKTLSSK